MQRPMLADIEEDNQSCITVVEAGYSAQLRHLEKHRRIALGVVRELCACDDINLRYVDTIKQKSDLMTKTLDRGKLEAARDMVGLFVSGTG